MTSEQHQKVYDILRANATSIPNNEGGLSIDNIMSILPQIQEALGLDADMAGMELTGPPKCPKCSNEADEPHPCPYDADVNNNPDSVCTCCPTCTQTCLDDI